MEAQARSHSVVERGRRAGSQLGLSREDLVALGVTTSRIAVSESGCRQRAVRQWSSVDNFWIMSHSKRNLEQMLRDLIEEASRIRSGSQASESLVDKHV